MRSDRRLEREEGGAFDLYAAPKKPVSAEWLHRGAPGERARRLGAEVSNHPRLLQYTLRRRSDELLAARKLPGSRRPDRVPPRIAGAGSAPRSGGPLEARRAA